MSLKKTASKRPPVEVGERVTLTIDKVIPKGNGLGRHNGFVVFVPRTFAGDTCEVEITKVQRRHGEGKLVSVVDEGPDRVTAPCPYHGTCGGCAWQAFDYDAQIRTKQSHVIEHLERITGLESPPVRDIIPAKNTLGYRNKMEYTFTRGEDGAVEAGFFKLGDWRTVVGVDPCLLPSEAGKTAHRVVVDWANRHELPVADREDVTAIPGALRTLVVRTAHNTDQVMVHLITNPGQIAALEDLVTDLQEKVPGIACIAHSENHASNDALMDIETIILWGNEYFVEKVHGSELRVRPMSFLQPNTEMAEVLYDEVEKAAALTGSEVVYDIYCGIGSISTMLAGNAKHVHGIEIVEEAIFDANENAVANGRMNCTFHTGNARPILKFIHDRDGHELPDVVVVDPPRSGLVPKVVRRIAEKEPDRFVYVSCNPATFARDAKDFIERGYELKYVQPVDQFPHSPHVELVALFEPA